jgi:hypothetical protein
MYVLDHSPTKYGGKKLQADVEERNSLQAV